jgi:hypothetical protein
MIFDVNKLEDYIKDKYNIKGDVEIFMNFDTKYGIYFRPKLENETRASSYKNKYSYLEMDEYKSYLRNERLKQLGI